MSNSGRLDRLQKILANAERVIRNALTGIRGSGPGTAQTGPGAIGREDWPGVIKRWQSVLDSKGGNAPVGAYLWLGRGHRALGDLDVAEAVVGQGLARHRNHLELTAEHAEIAMARRDWPAAIERWQLLLEKEGARASASVYLRLARAHRLSGDVAAAAAVIDDGSSRHPNHPGLTAEHAEIAMTRRDWPEAIKRWQAMLQAQPETAPASVYSRLARAHRIFGDLPAAETVVQTGLARHRNDVGLAAEYAELAMAQRLWPEAIKRWQAIVAAGGVPAPASAYLRLARAHRLHGDLPAAEAVIRDGLQRHPRDLELTAEHAEIASARQDWTEAIARWQAIVDNWGPKAPASAYVQLARLHRSQGDCGAAETAVREGLSRNRDNAELAAEHAEIAMAELDWPEAITRWQVILDLHGGNAPAAVRRRLQEAERRQAQRTALGFSGRRSGSNARRFTTSARWRPRAGAAAGPAGAGVGVLEAGPVVAGADLDAAAPHGLLANGGISGVVARPLPAVDDARRLRHDTDLALREERAPQGDRFGSFYVHSIWVVAELPRSPDATLVPELSVEIDGASAGTLTLGTVPGRSDGSFVFRIPADYCDDVEHSISVFVHAEGGFYLRSRQGWTTWPFRRRHKGQIDSFDAGILHGWVIDHLDPEGECEIKLFDGAVELGVFHTAVSRSDVNRTFEVSGRHGFRIPVPVELFDGRKHDLRVFAGDEEVASIDTPRMLALLPPAERPEAGARYIGHVDQADCHQVRGWAKDRSSTTPVHVRVEVDGVTVGVARAANFRNRSLADESHGHHGFRMALPRSLMNGQQREVGVFVVEGNVKLAGASNHPVNFPLRALVAPRLSREPLFDLANGIVRSKPAGVPTAADRTEPNAVRHQQGDDQTIAVSAIVLNWNGAELLDRFLGSLAELALPDLEVVVIDHASEDNSREIIESYSSRLQLNPVYRKGNFSFAESNNLGAKKARGEYLLIVNNDIIFVHDCIGPMRSQLDEHPEIGVVGLRLKEPDYHGEARWGLRDHHLGIEFVAESIGKGRFLYLPAEISELGTLARAPAPTEALERVAVTAALCMVRKSDFLAVGGFHTGYFYGSEDVDLCLSVRQALGKKTVCVCDAWAIHNRSATRDRKIASARTEANPYQDRARLANRNLLVHRFGPAVLFHTLRETIAGNGKWREAPPRVTFIVTAADLHTAAGDYFTAMELGEALRAEFGWDVAFAVMNQHSLAKSDLVVFMRFDYAVTEVKDLSPGAVLVAWIRNRVDQWIESGHLDNYHVIFCASQKAIDGVREATGRRAFLLPIASNTERFRLMPPSPKHKADVVFTGHHRGDERDAVNMLDPSTIDFSLAIYGAGWDKHEAWRDYSRGAVPYYELPEVYSSAAIVIDDSYPVTREWNSLNSQVFDALASGSLPLTNCEGGAREIFGDELPTFSWPEELRALIAKYLEAPEERKQLAASLRERVRAEHSYRVRAKTLKGTICNELARSLRIAIKVGIPRGAEKETWGDFHFAHSLRRAFERQGCYARVDIVPEWYGGFTAGDDVVIVLRGVSQYEIVPGPLTLMWLISHPDAVALAELQKFHHVFVASDFYADKLASRLGDRVSGLLQCVDTDIFRPGVAGELHDQVVFVGNTRGQRGRAMVNWAMEAGLDFRVYGSGWAGSVPAECYGGDYIPNDQLAPYYGNGNIILNDHWPDMGAEGFLSNRLFDAAAVEAKIISDPAEGLSSVFGDGITVCRSAEELKMAVARLRHDDCTEQRRAMREEILGKHTFDHRAAQILEVAKQMIGVSVG
jgi:GT2 family glycosyltransferase/spore maturation protein CgeB/tetratricopeptide (TPR) repeat protein